METDKPRVFLLQDNLVILRLWKLMLEKHGLTVVSAVNSIGAAGVIRSEDFSNVKVAVLDYSLGDPRLDGTGSQVANILLHERPNVHIINGSSENDAFSEFTRQQIVHPEQNGLISSILPIVLRLLSPTE